MGDVRRWLSLWVALLLAAGLAIMPLASASASSTPVQMQYACALKSSGSMSYVRSPTECNSDEKALTILPGPVYVCVHSNNSVYRVTALSKCPTPVNRRALTLPPEAEVYFCAADGSGALTYTTKPTLCTRDQFPVAVKPLPAPVLAHVESGTLQYYAGTPAVPVTSSITVSSRHAKKLVGATVKISSGLAASDDSLAFTNANGITGSYDSGTGVLTLTGTALVASYQAALRSVTYEDSNALTATATRKVSFQVNDGLVSHNLSNVVSRTINVKTNTPPAAGNVSASTDKNTAIDINVLSSASDPDGDPLSVASVDTTGTKGSVTVNGNGTIHYDPNGQFQNLLQGQTATDTFTYKVSDGFQPSNSATVTVTINGVNDPPVLANIESSTLQYDAGTPAVPVTSSLTVTSPDTTTLAGATVTIGSGFTASEDSLAFTSGNGITGSYDSTHGVLTLTGTSSVASYQTALQSVTYSDSNGTTPSTGTRTISFQVDDGLSAANLSNVVSRSVNVNPNSPPAAGNVSASTDKNTAIDINVLSSCSDPDGDILTVTGVDTTGTKGSVSINGDQTIHYDPNGQFQGLTQGQTATDTFTYTCSDGYFTSTGTVTVTINGVSDPPVISNIETSPVSYRAQDPAVQITSALTLSDDDDATMAGATVTITSGFSSGNDSLGFTNQNEITGNYDATHGVLTLTGNASLADYQDALQSVTFFTSDNSLSPAARTISFTVTDTVGGTSTGPAQRTINVAEANQPPVATNHSYTVVGNTPLGVGTTPSGPAATVSGSLLNGDSDPDSGGPISLTGNTSPAHGSVTVNPDGTFTYTPAAGFSGTDSFTYTITDSDDPLNPKTATATVTLTVGPVVWYVDNSESAGNGEAGSPFSTLAAANSAAGANSIIFLYQGNATYTGGVTLHSGEDLWGQPYGLSVDGYSLVAAGGSAPVITNSGGDGIDLAENADVEAVNVSGPSGNGIAAAGVSDATVGGTDAVAVSGAGGDGIHVSGGSGNLDFANTSVSGSAGHSVSVASHTGGTVSIGGNIGDNGTGISLTGNSGGTVSFGGKLTISTGANAGFSATGGGTVSAVGTGSTISTTTGTALNVSSTTIGTGGLQFQSISSNGANPGISLASTGTTAGLTVTGTGSAGTGGTVQNSAGEGISLSSTSSPSFTDMVIENNAGDGINGTQVSGLTLAGSTVSGNGTASDVNDTENEDGLNFSSGGTGSPNGLTGTVSIANSSITNNADNNAIISDTSGSLTLTVSGGAFSTNNATAGDDYGLDVNADGSTSATVSVTGATFKNNVGAAFEFATDPSASGTNSVTFSNNTVSSTSNTPGGTIAGGNVAILPSGSSKNTITVDGNGITNPVDDGISIDDNGTGTLSGTINGNTVGSASVTGSGSSEQNDIGVSVENSATETLAITSNKLYWYSNPAGIEWSDREGNPTLNLTVTGNTIADPNGNATQGGAWGIYGEGGALSTDSGTVCADVSGNSVTGAGQVSLGSFDIELDQTGSVTYELPGYTGPSYSTGTGDASSVVSFLATNNSDSTANISATTTGPGGFSNTPSSASCPSP